MRRSVEQAADEAFAAIAEVNRLMSDYRGDSELTMVNRAAAMRPVSVSPPLFAVLEAADRVSHQSDGAFDITAHALAGLWEFADHRPRVPSAQELAAVRPMVDYRQVSLDRQAKTIRFGREGVQIDVDSLAKGFAAEIAASSLARRDLAGVVDTGVSQYMVGLPPGKRSWSVGLGHPDRPGTLLGAIDVDGSAISTTSAGPASPSKSAVSPRLDPRTLQPAGASLSATVVSDDGTLSQALSNAVFVLGPTAGLTLLSTFPHTWGVVAYRHADGRVRVAVSRGHTAAFHPVAEH